MRGEKEASRSSPISRSIENERSASALRSALSPQSSAPLLFMVARTVAALIVSDAFFFEQGVI